MEYCAFSLAVVFIVSGSEMVCVKIAAYIPLLNEIQAKVSYGCSLSHSKKWLIPNFRFAEYCKTNIAPLLVRSGFIHRLES